MTTTVAPIKKEQSNGSSSEIKKGIENHKVAAEHHQEAAKSHLEAAKHHEDGNHEKAAQSTIVAHGHNSLANDAQKEDVKHHATNSKH
jgi:hypothetical protein